MDAGSSSYKVRFTHGIPLAERTIFPYAADELNGMEDVRLVQIEDGYLGTFTAYDGKRIQSKVFHTGDFEEFAIHNLSGNAVAGKGIAIFPRKVNGKYVALGRQDGYSLTVMYSDSWLEWNDAQPLFGPSYAWDATQIGNCGSPIETPDGWLVITHGVGPMRRYTLGIALLDLEDPGRVIRYLDQPIMEPNETEREGYVPNVLYTCGWMKHNDHILMPYAMSDSACGFALLEIQSLLDELKRG